MKLLTTLLAISLMTACTSMAASPAKDQGGMLTNANGMTLYVFDNDVAGAGKSACNAECAAKWPPLSAGSYDKGTGDYSIINRDDGTMQWAYKGKPLYLWLKDQKPGDMTGDGVKGVWHVARP
jgi:predicted lipoprotein with Yx(FWY)xxD motif